VHVIIAVIALCDVIVTKIPIRLLHVYISMIFGSFYVIVTLLLHWTGVVSNIYPEYLDWALEPRLAVAVSLGLILAGCPLVHVFVYCVYKVRLCIRF